MTRDEIIETLRSHSADLRGLGVESLALFGSLARGDAGETADIDLAATYDEAVVRSLLDQGGIAAAIERYLGTDDFDLADERRLRPTVRASFLQDHVRLF